VRKKKLLILYLLGTCYLVNYSHATKNSSSECTGKITKERHQLFVQAENHEQNLINIRAQCLQAHDCDVNRAFQQAKGNVLFSIIMLMNHYNELEKESTDGCKACEKTETIDIKNRLVELLQSTQ
jgi:hypothetical protein